MFCVRGFGGGVGVSLFFGGLFWLVRRVFSGFWGFLCFSLFCSCCWGGWRVAGGSGVRGRRARVSCFLLVGGQVWGAPARARVACFLVVGGRVRGCVLPGSRGGGRVVPGFLFVFAVLLSCSRGVFGCCFFPSGASRVFWFCGAWSFVGLWFPRGRGVVGGVGLGWGCFFSGCCARSGFGLVPCWGLARVRVRVLVLFGEFDPGSGRTLAACLTHASRTGPPLWGWVEWRTGEYHVSNLPPAPG